MQGCVGVGEDRRSSGQMSAEELVRYCAAVQWGRLMPEIGTFGAGWPALYEPRARDRHAPAGGRIFGGPRITAAGRMVVGGGEYCTPVERARRG